MVAYRRALDSASPSYGLAVRTLAAETVIGTAGAVHSRCCSTPSPQICIRCRGPDTVAELAHNNFGVVFLNAGKLYEAAREFEWARKLMPGHPDPRVNLGICLDRAGRIDDAMASFDAALQVSPEHLPAIHGAALLTVRAGREEPRLLGWLNVIELRGDGRWQHWARASAAQRP